MEKKIINKWKDYYAENGAYECPYCHEVYYVEFDDMEVNKYNFCPNCGKKLITVVANNATTDIKSFSL